MAETDEALRRVVDAVHRPIRDALMELVGDFERSLEVPLGEGIRRHREAADAAGLEGDPPETRTGRLEQLGVYRKAVTDGLLSPLVVFLSGRGPSARWRTRLADAVERARVACGELPETEELPWRADALDRRPSDGTWRGLGKALARAAGRAREGETRPVALRALARRHVDHALATRLDRTGVESIRAWAAWTRALEEACVAWGDRALPALVEAGLPEPTGTGTAAGEAGDDREAATRTWTAVREAAVALDARLSELLETAPHRTAVEHIDDALAEARARLADDLAVAGAAFVGRMPADAPARDAARRLLPGLARLAPPMVAWEDGVEDRLRLYDTVLSILAGANAVEARLVDEIRAECLTEIEHLVGVADALARRADDVARGVETDTPAGLRTLEAEVSALLEPARAAVPGKAEVEDAVRSACDGSVDALLAMIRHAPESLSLHPHDASPPAGTALPDTRTVGVQELARQAFDALRIERMRASGLGIVSTVDQARSDVAELFEVVDFAFAAAREELEDGGEDGVRAPERSRELVVDALRSVAESLRSTRAAVERAAVGARARLAAEIAEGSLALLDRLNAGRVQARLLAARSRLAEARAYVNERWGPSVERTARALRARSAILWRRLNRNVRRGSALVAGAPSAEATSSRSVRALAETEAVISSLPLVYQRLFTLDPIDDRTLLTDRTSDLGAALARWTRWRAGDGVPLVVQGRPGSGITTFLNVLVQMIEEGGATTAQVDLRRRIVDEAPLATRLADALGLAGAGPSEAPGSIDALSAAIFEAEPGTLPDAVAVDNLEHLYLRVPGGTSLVERVLTLMTETEPRIFWIAGVTTSAWQLIRATEPSAVGQVDVVELERLSPGGLREAITVRHRRSGLPVRFEEPEQGRVLLRRRLRRMRDPEAYQETLREDFFDQLYRTSSGHIGLGLFQWLSAADFGDDGRVTMRPPERPNFSVLDALDLQQNFTLKAFLEHRTLSLAEHDRVFRLPRQESYQIFESLGSRHLIEAVGRGPESSRTRSEIQADLRYRIRPLLVGAVVAHLQGRNIVH